MTLDDGTTVDAGGAAYLATHVKQLRAEVNELVRRSSAGDNIGASPLASALFHDEPTIAVLNAIGVDASAVGNHEFDEGYKELKRIQFGGCHPTDGCQFRDPYRGADSRSSARMSPSTTAQPAVLPFTVKVSGGVPIGIIGITLQGSARRGDPERHRGPEVRRRGRRRSTSTAKLLDRLGSRPRS